MKFEDDDIGHYFRNCQALDFLGRAQKHLTQQFRFDLSIDEAKAHFEARRTLLVLAKVLLDEMELLLLRLARAERVGSLQ